MYDKSNCGVSHHRHSPNLPVRGYLTRHLHMLGQGSRQDTCPCNY